MPADSQTGGIRPPRSPTVQGRWTVAGLRIRADLEAGDSPTALHTHFIVVCFVVVFPPPHVHTHTHTLIAVRSRTL